MLRQPPVLEFNAKDIEVEYRILVKAPPVPISSLEPKAKKKIDEKKGKANEKTGEAEEGDGKSNYKPPYSEKGAT